MRRPTSIEPFTPSSTVSLHPILQAALDNLDVKVEEELARYRRQRRYPGSVAQQPAARSSTLRSSAPRQLTLPATDSALGILENGIQRPAPRSSIYETGQAGYELVSSAPGMAGGTSPAADPAFEATDDAWQDTFHQTAPQQTAPQQAVPPSLNQSAIAPAPVDPAPSDLPDSQSILSYSDYADLSAYAPNATLQRLAHPTDPQIATQTPSDYFASSEELLRSIAEDEAELRAELQSEPASQRFSTLLTPLGVGSMLLLLLSSTMLGYVVMNPTVIQFTANSDPVQPTPASPAPNIDRATTPSPDLSAEEFVDLDLDTLSTIPRQTTTSSKPNAAADAAKSKNGATRTAQPRSSNPQASGNSGSSSSASSPTASRALPTVPAPQPSFSTVVVSAEPPVAPAPDPAPVAAPPEPEPVVAEPISAAPPAAADPAPEIAAAPTSPTQASGNYYYVVTDYSGDPSLESARDVVPDAYVRNLPEAGAKVQFGAFNDEAKAQEMRQQLQEQGISAEVYRPE